MDVLSDVLRVVRLSGAVFFVAQFTEPWAVKSPPAKHLAPLIMPGAECFSLFHILVEGSCWVEVQGKPPLRMEAGDVLVVPQGDEHVMASDLRLPPVPMTQIVPQIPRVGMPPVRYGGDGDAARFVCGYSHCDQRFNPLFGTLPELLCVRSRDGSVALEPAGHVAPVEQPETPLHESMWLNTTIYYLILEAQSQPSGGGGMAARLTELMFIQVLRQYMEQLPPNRSGWLAGVRDPHVGKALEAMHSDPARNWTVEDLAKHAGLSRSALANRFAALIGTSPMRYLSEWRIQIAKQLISEGRLNLAEVAERIGYDSEYAFNRAFKRHVGSPPATWRKHAGAIEPRSVARARA